MTKKKAKAIFDKYNPNEVVKRCPKGRAGVRDLLDEYAVASVNLYGIIPKSDLVEIFNSHNTEQTNINEVYTLLLPLVLKEGYYCFYKDYLVHYIMFDDFDLVEFYIDEQSDKPRYIPNKEEFLKFVSYEHCCKQEIPYWDAVFQFIVDNWSEEDDGLHIEDELLLFNSALEVVARQGILHLIDIFDIFKDFNIPIKDEKQLNEFTALYTEAYNNARTWINKGYSPAEMYKIIHKQGKSDEVEILPKRKIGVNDPCPCGSGKKNKKCCQKLKKNTLTYLSPIEIILFFDTWYGLLGYVNEKKKVVDAVVVAGMPGTVKDIDAYKIRCELWKNPKLIDEYLNSTKLPQEKVKLLKSWRHHHIKGTFLIWQYREDSTLFTQIKKNSYSKTYAVKGLSEPISEVISRGLPRGVEAVIMPFMDKIIYDGFVNPYDFELNVSANELALQELDKLAKKKGIITQLG